MAKKTTNVVAFIRSQGDTNKYRDMSAYGHITVFFGTLDERGLPVGFAPSSWGDEHEIAFADLTVRNQVSDGSKPEWTPVCESYGWSVEYRQCHSVDLREAEIMVKTLRKIKRGMDRAYNEHGSALSFGQYVARALNVLGVDKVIVLQEKEWRDNGDMSHRVRKPGAMINEIDHLSRKLRGQLVDLAA